MKTKKFLSMLLALALMVGFAVPSFAALTPADIEDEAKAKEVAEAIEDVYTEKHNFAGQGDTVFTVTADSYKASNLLDADGAPETKTGAKTDYQIDFLNEKLVINEELIDTAADGTRSFKDETCFVALHPVKQVSFDGGNKWTAINIGLDGVDISKELNKSVTIMLTDNLDTTDKPSVPKVGAKIQNAGKDNEVAAVAGSVTYTFKATAERPKAEKFKPDYLTFAKYGQWSAPSGVDTTKLDISVADSTGKAPTHGWFKFYNSKTSPDYKGYGIEVQDLINGKPGKVTYLVRLSPDPKTLTPASAPFKLGVATVQKAPTFKIDYKKEIIKVKADTQWDIGETGTSYYNSIGQWVSSTIATTTETDGTVTVNDGYTAVESKYIYFGELCDKNGKALNVTGTGDNIAPVTLDKDAAKAGIALATDKYNLYGQTIGVRTAATEKKPASAVQLITIADQAQLFQVDFKPSFAKGKMTVDKKTYEFYDETKQKWGGAPKEAGTYKVRIKNTAKYDVKTDKTAGNVNSQAMEVTLVSGSYDPAKPEKTGLISYTVKSFPKYDGLVWVNSVKDGADKAVTAVAADGKIKDGTSSYLTYTSTGFVLNYALVTSDAEEKTGFSVFTGAEVDVLVNPTEDTLAALTAGKTYVVVTLENEDILKGLTGGKLTAAYTALTGIVQLTVQGVSTTTLQDLTDSIVVSTYYAPKAEDGMTEKQIATQNYTILLASKFYSPAIPVTVVEPKVTVTLPEIEGGVTAAINGGTDVEVLLSDIATSLVITLTPAAGKAFVLPNGKGTVSTVANTDLFKAAAVTDFVAKLGTTALTTEVALSGALTITIPVASIKGDVALTVTTTKGLVVGTVVTAD